MFRVQLPEQMRLYPNFVKLRTPSYLWILLVLSWCKWLLVCNAVPGEGGGGGGGIWVITMRNEENIFCDKMDNIPGKWGYKEYKKRKFGKQLGKSKKKFTKYKRFRKELRKPFKKYYKKIFNYKKRNVTQNTSKDKSKCKCWTCGELGHYSNECQKEKRHLLYGEKIKKLI